MCGHGVMGLVVTLAHLGRIKAGAHRIETPAGVVTATLHAYGAVSVENVASYREAGGVTVRVPSGDVTGDVAWGGNWFFLVENPAAFTACRISKVKSVSRFTFASVSSSA